MSEEYSLDETMLEVEEKMEKTVASFEHELTKIRTGRASSSLVEHILVDYYGTQTPISQMATISTPESRTIAIQPWDITAIGDIEKAILKSELGINPSNDGKLIRLNIPELTEDRRKELVKHIGKLTEEYRVSIRQSRKDVNSKIKDAEKEEGIPEDDIKKALNNVQELTDKFIAKINATFEKKQKDVMEV